MRTLVADPLRVAFAVAVLAVAVNIGTILSKAWTLHATSSPHEIAALERVHRASGPSLHRLDVPIETANGRTITFGETGGRARIVTMFYGSCPQICPATVDTLKLIDRQLTSAEREATRVMLITFDPATDSPAALNAIKTERRIDSDRWILGRTAPADVPKLAAALGFHLRPLPNGEFDHKGMLILLDSKGHVIARTSKMGTPDPAFVDAVRRAATAESTDT